MSNAQDILRILARANGWQVLAAGNYDTYQLPDDPTNGIEVWWAASGGVLMAASVHGNGDFVHRHEDASTKTERVLSALAARTDEFPERRTNDAAVGHDSTPSVFLSAEDATMLPMRWFARPEGDSKTLRFTPRLASWNKAGHPDQVQLRAYLDDTEALLAGSRIDGPWALRLDVGLPPGQDLLNVADLDNYAYPLAHHLKDSGLVSVWCTKQHSEQSFVRIEPAQQTLSPSTDLLVVGTTASASTIAYKEQVHAAVLGAAELPAGPIRLEIAFVVGPGRNWLNLWKQTIDSLDPLLGSTYPHRQWNPLDGRITELGMHLAVDPAVGNDVLIGIAPASADGSHYELRPRP